MLLIWQVGLNNTLKCHVWSQNTSDSIEKAAFGLCAFESSSLDLSPVHNIALCYKGPY